MADNDLSLDLIKKSEGLRLKPYVDADHFSVGYGHKLNKDELKKFSRGITPQLAEQFLQKDLKHAYKAIDTHVRVPLNKHQRAALASFTYNVGEANLKNSTLLKKLNQSKHEEVFNELNKWVYSKKKILPGLVKRRLAEANLYKKPVENDSVPAAPVDSMADDTVDMDHIKKIMKSKVAF